MSIKLQMTFDVEISLDEVAADDIEMVINRIQNNLSQIAYKGIEEGMVTDDTAAEVEDYSISVDEVSADQAPQALPRPQ